MERKVSAGVMPTWLLRWSKRRAMERLLIGTYLESSSMRCLRGCHPTTRTVKTNFSRTFCKRSFSLTSANSRFPSSAQTCFRSSSLATPHNAQATAARTKSNNTHFSQTWTGTQSTAASKKCRKLIWLRWLWTLSTSSRTWSPATPRRWASRVPGTTQPTSRTGPSFTRAAQQTEA